MIGGMGGFQRPCGYEIGPQKFPLGSMRSSKQLRQVTFFGVKRSASNLCTHNGWNALLTSTPEGALIKATFEPHLEAGIGLGGGLLSRHWVSPHRHGP